jgi:GT2 family glycosyltransferase/tetratricopeptide (TPR) repeat protein
MRPAEEADALLAGAWQAFAAGDAAGARRQAEAAIAAEPDRPGAKAALGFFLLRLGEAEAAEAVLSEAAGTWPDHAPAHWYLGCVLQARGDPAAAAQALRLALRLDPTLDEAAFTLGWILHDRGEWDEALLWAAQAHAARPGAERALQLGWLNQQLRRPDVAAQVYQAALADLPSASPLHARLQLHLAQVLGEAGQAEKAGAVLQEALRAHPDDAALQLEAAWQLRRAGDAGAALARARSVTERQPAQAQGWYLLGLLHEEAGALTQADAAYAEAHALRPDHVEALVRRALIQRGWKRFEGARWLADLARRAAPHDAGVQTLQAQLLLDEGATREARQLLVRRLRRRENAPDLWRLLASAQVQAGRPGAARASLRRALAADAGNVEALRTAGWLALEQGDLRDATVRARQLLALRPEDAVAQVQAAFIFAAAGELREAERFAQAAVAAAPQEPEAWRALSQVRYRQGRLDAAEAAIGEALRLAPERIDNLRHLGWVLLASGQHARAELAFLRARDLAPTDEAVALESAECLRRGGRLDAALDAANALLAGWPAWPAALLLKARVLAVREPVEGAAAVACCQQLMRQGALATEAARMLLTLEADGIAGAAPALRLVAPGVLYRAAVDAITDAVHAHGPARLTGLVAAALRRFEDDGWLQTAALYTATLSGNVTAEALAEQARAWWRSVKIRAGLSPMTARARDRRRPRVAYLASQPHEPLLRRVLAAHDPARIEVFLFAARLPSDLPADVQGHPLEPGHLAAACAANGIDVVVDAGGLHPFGGQFDVLARTASRLAPVQVGWLGTGCSAGGLFDALWSDRAAVPRDQERHYEEQVVCMEGGAWCWDPPPFAPAVGEPPVLRNGTLTFGVVARPLRLSDQALDAFGRIVAGCEEARLRFLGAIADDLPLRRHVLARLARHGVAEQQVSFEPWRTPARYLAWCGEVDLVLDTFPGNGGLSLLEPLWMGVPVVTVAGDWIAARQGASLLTAIGRAGWIAEDADSFVMLALALARDTGRLRRERAGLREAMRTSPLLDGRRLAAQIEAFCDSASRACAGDPADDAKASVRAQADRALAAWMAVPRAIVLPAPARPALTVVVVLYNQPGLARRTLQALADQRGCDFETVIVDNASDAATAQLLLRVAGARLVRNSENLGFLAAANQGAALARGRAIAFLNSDAFLQADALAQALAAIDADGSIGALGGRVVLTAGGLQEAGNVIFRDGSAGGIGRGEDPWQPAARPARATDYVSGVFLVTPRALWQALGGFDAAFGPAYYEDTDYCLRVWQAGFRCVVEPRVLLEHVEWGSAEGASATGLMRHNRAAFVARHGAWLAGQPEPMALPLDADRWRAPEDRPTRRPRVLVIDNEVPHAWKGGGLPRARSMLHALAGWPVTFYPLWGIEDSWTEIEASVPRSTEVALGLGLGGLEDFLQRRRGVYDVLLVSRPPNLRALAPLRRRRPDLFAGLRLVYDAEALFALRDIALAGVRGRPFPRAQAAARVAEEVALAADAADVLVVSQRDARHFRQAGLRTHVLAHSIAVRRAVPDAAARDGLLFVGALHPRTPNEDGLLWFVHEVLPRLARRRGQAATLSVVGVCQSPDVAALDGPVVRIVGMQEALEPWYDAARVFVAPVRFAGGVPAKVIEAAAHGIPVVASSLLVRQLGWHDGTDIQGARDPDAFADRVARLLDDEALWRRQQAAAWTQCARRYDPALFAQILRSVLAPATHDPVAAPSA